MADPITWGLLNLIKKRVKGVQTTLDGVSDKVSGLPDSLDADFTEVKEAIADVKSDTSTTLPEEIETCKTEIRSDISNVETKVDNVDGKIFDIKNKVVNETDLASSYSFLAGDIRNSQGNVAVVNVSGSGYLNYAVLEVTASSGAGNITIKIDDKTFTMNTTGSHSTGFLNLNSMVAYNWDGRSVFLNNIASFSAGIFNNFSDSKSTKASFLSKNDYMNGKAFGTLLLPVLFNGKIRFNNKLQVNIQSTVSSSGSDSVRYGVLYELD